MVGVGGGGGGGLAPGMSENCIGSQCVGEVAVRQREASGVGALLGLVLGHLGQPWRKERRTELGA